MSSEWQATTTTDLIADGVLHIGDGYRAKNSELSDEGLPFARAANVNGTIDVDGAELLCAPSVAKAGDKVSRAGDTVFTSKGTVGRFAFVSPQTRSFVYSPQLCYWRSLDSSKLEPRFLFYWLQGPEAWSQFSHLKGQTDMADYVSLGDQRRMRLTVPRVREQRRIAGVLAALDNKIEHNRGIAQRLSDVTATAADALFARARTEVWPEDTIGERVSVYGGATPSTKEPDYWGGDTAFATPKDLADLAFPVLLSTERTITDEGVAKISSGTLPRGTLLLSSRAPIGYLAIAELPVAVNQGFIAMVCDRGLSNHYVMEWARRSYDVIVAAANGTTFLEISKRAFRPLEIPVPPDELHAEFADLAECLHQRRVAALRENTRLASIRDALLPKLVSGQIRVSDRYDPDDVLGTVAEAAGMAAP